MDTPSTRYSSALKQRILKLSDNTEMSAAEIIEKLKQLKPFKKEAKSLSTRSIYDIRHRYAIRIDEVGNGNGNGNGAGHTVIDYNNNDNGHKQRPSKPLAEECLVSNHGDQTTLTISIPTNKVSEVMKKLGF